MHRRYGTLPWRSLFDDAIALAEEYPVSHSLAERFSSSLEGIKVDPGCASVYMPNGRAIQIGDMLRQPALARTLRTIADEGADAFCRGAIAQRIDEFFEERGGLIRASDLAAYDPLWTEPAISDYRGHQVEVMPPNSLDVLLLMQLNGLSALDSATLMENAGRRAGYQMSALKAAAGLSKRWSADRRGGAGRRRAFDRRKDDGANAGRRVCSRRANTRAQHRRYRLPADRRRIRKCGEYGAERVQRVRSRAPRSGDRHHVQQPDARIHSPARSSE